MNRTMLLIDDEDALRERLARAFRKRAYTVLEARTAVEALSLLQTTLPAFVLLDLRLGADSGLDLLPRLREAAPEARVVILTGYGSISTAVAATRMGVVQYLTKPVSVDEIEDAFLGEAEEVIEGLELETPSLARVEWEHLQRVLSDCDGNVTKAAKTLRIHRRSLQRKLTRYAPP